ncbi:helix-turn-helix domain-containing protein [Sorangium sp. So ce302]
MNQSVLRHLAQVSASHGIDYLDGGIMAVPEMIGGPGSAILYSGSQTAFDAHRARRLASNRGDVSRKFRRDQGLSLTEYKNRLQTLKLLELLEQGCSHLTHAALEAGFGSYSRCHQVIRELLGMAPSALLDPGTRKLLADRLEPLSAQHDCRDPG